MNKLIVTPKSAADFKSLQQFLEKSKWVKEVNTIEKNYEIIFPAKMVFDELRAKVKAEMKTAKK